MTRAIILALLALLQPETVVPVHQESRHRVILERGAIRVLDVQIPPGDTTLFHTHDSPILYVRLGSSSTRSQVLGGEWTQPRADAAPEPPGRLSSTTSYATEPLTHRINNVGTNLFRLIGITNPYKGTVAPEPRADGAVAELTNPWFRAFRVKLAAGASTDQHRHAYPIVMVEVPSGAISWIDANTAHALTNKMAAPAELVEVEILGLPQTSLATAEPTSSGYMCPMHPDVMSATPGKCPRCSMELVPGNPLALPDFKLEIETTPRVIKAGQPTTFRFSVRHPLTGEPHRDFAIMHDRPYHLFVVSRDMQEFSHIHPEFQPDGSFTIQVTFPKPGHYTLFSDFLPVGGGAQVVATPIVTAGIEPDAVAAQARLTPDPPWIRETEGVKVELLNQPTTFQGGEQVDLLFRFTHAANGTPVTDLQRYLGAWGHLLILSEDMTEYVHAHPRDESQPDPEPKPTGGPEVIFDALLPKAGRYRAWLQFQREAKLSTVSFIFNAPRPGDLH